MLCDAAASARQKVLDLTSPEVAAYKFRQPFQRFML